MRFDDDECAADLLVGESLQGGDDGCDQDIRGPLTWKPGNHHSGMLAEWEATDIREVQIGGDENAILELRQREDGVVGCAAVPGFADMDGILAESTQRRRQRAWQILIDQEACHLLADGADALV